MKAKAKTEKKADKLNKLERSLAEKQISQTEYELWKKVYMNENKAVEKEELIVRKKKRKA